MPSITQGRIVYALDPIPDPQGRNPKRNRPFVVISTFAEIENGERLTVVGISRSVRGGPDEVELPYGPSCHTRLRERSAAQCSWTTEIQQDRVEVQNGFVPPTYLRQILEKAQL